MKGSRSCCFLFAATGWLPAGCVAGPAWAPPDIPPAGTMSELAVPAVRSPGSPGYGEICFSPRRSSWGGRDVVDVARVFRATRIEWMYVDDRDGPVLEQFRDMGLTLGLALANSAWDTTEYRPSPLGFAGRPGAYTEGRVLNIDGEILDGRGSMHDPAFREVTRRWLRLMGEFGADRIHRDEPGWQYSQWDFNPHALSQFNAYLAGRVPAETLDRLDIGDPMSFDLKDYIRNRPPAGSAPAEFRRIWEEFRLETLLAWYDDLREWTRELVGPDVEWSANYSSFIHFRPIETWSDYAITELQPSGGQFGIGNPWSLYRKIEIARELGKAIVVTLGSHDVYENKVMIGLTYAMGAHMLCPYGVYMKDRPRRFDDPALYSDIYDFVARWGGTYLVPYEEAFALGNGIVHPLTRAGSAPVAMEDPGGQVYAFVRAQPGRPDAPVVIHLVNYCLTGRPPVALTLDPDRFFPGRGLKLTLLRPEREPEVLSDGWQARVELPSPEPWQMLVVEPASESRGVWAPEVDTEDFAFFEDRVFSLRSRTAGAEIRYTTDGSLPGADSAPYTEPVRIDDSAVVKARAFAGGRASPVSAFSFTRRPPNALRLDASLLRQGLNYELREGVRISPGEDLDDPMAWAGGQYRYETARSGRIDRIVLPEGHPESLFSVIYTGYVHAPRDGVYTFFANVDDECFITVAGERVIRQSGRKVPPDLGMTETRGRVLLSRGLHEIRVEYVQMYHDLGLEVRWEGPGIPRQPIAPEFFRRPEGPLPGDAAGGS